MEQYIIFRVLNQNFAVSILSISRIIPLSEITPVPDTADYIMGVMESEKQVVPIIDLSKRFFNQSLTQTDQTQVILMYWNDLEIGVTVDEVVQITHFGEEQVDSQLEKITALEDAAEVTPIKSFIRSEEGIILEVSASDLFDMKGTLMIQDLIESYL